MTFLISQSLLNLSVNYSLGAQWITLIIGLIALVFYWLNPLKTKEDDSSPILPQILSLEMIVQIIELVFYTWYLGHLASDVTAYRYYDWVLTTPMMLISTTAFFSYMTTTQRPTQNQKMNQINNDTTSQKPFSTIQEWASQNWISIIIIVFANFIMLLFGYLQELSFVSLTTSTLFGFAAFVISFYEIYRSFVGDILINQFLYWIMFSLWSLYGVAATFSPLNKNFSYNILDIFSKNFYGIFLSGVLLMNKL